MRECATPCWVIKRGHPREQIQCNHYEQHYYCHHCAFTWLDTWLDSRLTIDPSAWVHHCWELCAFPALEFHTTGKPTLDNLCSQISYKYGLYLINIYMFCYCHLTINWSLYFANKLTKYDVFNKWGISYSTTKEQTNQWEHDTCSYVSHRARFNQTQCARTHSQALPKD